MFQKILRFFYKRRIKINPSDIHVLVVEDDPVQRRYLEATLTGYEFKVSASPDAATGLQMAQDVHPDLVILDYHLPDSTGLALCEKIKKSADLAETPVIFLTSNESPKNILDCYDAGGENYLIKPVDQITLVRQIESALLSAATYATGSS